MAKETGRFCAKRVRAIEQEYGEPFWDVVRGFAEMGYSRSMTGRLLGYNAGHFCMAVMDLPGIVWPSRSEAMAKALGPMTSAHLANSRAASARRRRRYHVRGQWLTIAEMAERVGTKYAAIYSRLRRGVPVDRLLDSTMSPSECGRLGARATNRLRACRVAA